MDVDIYYAKVDDQLWTRLTFDGDDGWIDWFGDRMWISAHAFKSRLDRAQSVAFLSFSGRPLAHAE